VKGRGLWRKKGRGGSLLSLVSDLLGFGRDENRVPRGNSRRRRGAVLAFALCRKKEQPALYTGGSFIPAPEERERWLRIVDVKEDHASS